MGKDEKTVFNPEELNLLEEIRDNTDGLSSNIEDLTSKIDDLKREIHSLNDSIQWLTEKLPSE